MKMVAYNVDGVLLWKPLDALAGGYFRSVSPKKITWEENPSGYITWVGALICENFSAKEYRNMTNWSKEMYGDNAVISYGIVYGSSKNANKEGRITWIKADLVNSNRDYPIPNDNSVFKIDFKNEHDAIAFKLTWAGDTT